MDATYIVELEKDPNLSPEDFIDRYINEGWDIEDTEDFISQLKESLDQTGVEDKENLQLQISKLKELVTKLKNMRW